MAPRSSARTTVANNANATRSSNRLAGRPPTNGGLPSTTGITKKPRKQPSRRSETNAERIASAVEENEQASQPTGERTSPAEELVSEQGPQPAGERIPLAEVLANEQRLRTASERTPSAEVPANAQRTHSAGRSTPPAELLASEQRIQSADEHHPAAEASVNANNGIRETLADGSLHRYDEGLRHSDQLMSDNGGDQGDNQGGRELESRADESAHSPTHRYDEEPRYPDSPDQYRRLHWYEDGERVEVLINRRIRVRGRYLSNIRGHYGESDDEDMEQGPVEPDGDPDGHNEGYAVITGYNDRSYSNDEYSEQGPVEPDGDPDGLDADPAPPYDDYAEEQLLKVLFACVTTQRALRRKREELCTCRQAIQDANSAVRLYQKGLNGLVPHTEHDWFMHRATQGKIVEWTTRASENQDLETRINLQIEFLEERNSKYARPPQRFQHLSRESQPLRFLSQNENFWESFAENEATCRSLMEIDVKLRQSNEDKNALDEAITRTFKRNLDLVIHASAPLSATKEAWAFQDISQVPDLFNKHRELQASKLAAEKMQAEQWMHLLSLAETAFINAEILTPMEETQKAEGEEGGGEDNDEEIKEVPEQGLPEPDAPLRSDSEVMKDGVRATLNAAKDACLKAREDFETARKFSNEEIAQLPQPATEDVLGAARVEKLARLTRALLVAEEAFNNAKKRAREVGIMFPFDRTADFTDDSDDGYAASLLERAVAQSRDRVARVQGWTGLYLDPQETETVGVQTFLPLTLQKLRPVRLGEDSFDLTEADGRTRSRIDAMAAVTKSLRGNAEFPQADKDTPMIDRDE